MKKQLFVFVLVVGLSACGGGSSNSGDGSSNSDFKILSSSYSEGEAIPLKYVCNRLGGSNISPQYSWHSPPSDTSSYAVIMDDEVAPCGSGDDACRHWAVFNIPSSVTSLVEDLDISTIQGATVGENYNGGLGYEGPCPPNSHTYKTTVYALGSNMPTVSANQAYTRSEFQSQYSQHIAGSATISGVFTP